MLSFQSRTSKNDYLLPVYSWASGNTSTKPATQTSSTSKYFTPLTQQYSAPKPVTVNKPVYPAYQQTQNLMRQSSTYKTPTATPQKTSTPQQQRQYAPPAPQQESPLSKLQQIGASRQQFYQTQADQEAERQKKIFDVRSNALQAQIPELETRLSNYRNLTGEAIKNQEEQTRLAREQIQQDSGEEMRLNAQTAREGRARLQNTLAGLNALDSSATGQLLAKAEGNLTNAQATALREQKRQLAQADQGLLEYKRNAQYAIDDEISKFNQAIREISANMDINSLEYQNAVKQAYDKAQESIYNIEESVARAEMEVQNIYDKAFAEQQAKQLIAGGDSEAQQKAMNMIDIILGGNPQAISGGWRPGNIPVIRRIFGGGQESTAYQGLKDLLTVAQRKQLTGQGQISDFETRMLQSAALAGLDPTKQSEEEFIAALQQVQRDLAGQGAVSGMGTQTIRVQSPDGQVGTIDASELEAALASGWRQI